VNNVWTIDELFRGDDCGHLPIIRSHGNHHWVRSCEGWGNGLGDGSGLCGHLIITTLEASHENRQQATRRGRRLKFALRAGIRRRRHNIGSWGRFMRRLATRPPREPLKACLQLTIPPPLEFWARIPRLQVDLEFGVGDARELMTNHHHRLHSLLFFLRGSLATTPADGDQPQVVG
jgi:hypothetical protein